MPRSPSVTVLLGLLLLGPSAGCSYVVEFDRSLLLDAGVDGGDGDAGFELAGETPDQAERPSNESDSGDEP
jgi:hypothetical protein